MKKRGWLLVVLAAVALSVMAYGQWFSREARVERVADQFMQAITNGDVQRVQAMIAPDAKVSADQWVARGKGMRAPQGGSAVSPALENPCGIEMMAVSALWSADGTPHGLSLLFKRVQGDWLVYQSDGAWC